MIAGDVSVDGLGLDDDGRALFATCTTVIHSAARVSFDSPLDAAVEVNLVGPLRVLEAVQDGGRRHRQPPAHLITVSTAYVAGSRRGLSPEAPLRETPFSTEVDWRNEVAAARRTRADADAESRRPELLARFTKEARDELGAAGPPLLAAKAEKRREAWLSDWMVEAGRQRAKALGWPDAYAYTKALAERAVHETKGDVPVSVVRPSIIESALAEPSPGWIRGFRMAEPVIISYGRGLLKEFPGIPEGIIDVIPVDLVVAAIIAVAAAGPEPDSATCSRWPPATATRCATRCWSTWCGSTSRPTRSTTPTASPSWSRRGSSPAGDGPRSSSSGASRCWPRPRRWSATSPSGGRRRRSPAGSRSAAPWASGPSTTSASTAPTPRPRPSSTTSRLRALWATLDADDQAAFCFDTTVIDWRTYVQEGHMPSVVKQARVRTTSGGREGLSRYERGKRAVLSPDRHIAAFDLENTLIASNVVESYSWLATRHKPDEDRPAFVMQMLSQAPGLLSLDRKDRGDFLRHFYRRYEDAPADELREDAKQLFSYLLLTKSFPEGFRRVREHQKLGHRTVLITGSLDFIVEPLRPLFDEIVCARLAEKDGRFTGELLDSPPTGEARALLMASTTPRPRGCRCPSPSPTPTPPVTFPCWRRSDTPWPSTPSPSWPPSPASGAGTWSSGPSRRAGPRASCRWRRAWSGGPMKAIQ